MFDPGLLVIKQAILYKRIHGNLKKKKNEVFAVTMATQATFS